jgi:hypothetical protein
LTSLFFFFSMPLAGDDVFYRTIFQLNTTLFAKHDIRNSTGSCSILISFMCQGNHRLQMCRQKKVGELRDDIGAIR